MPLELGNKNRRIINEVLLIAAVFLFTIVFVIISGFWGYRSSAQNYLQWLAVFIVLLYTTRLIVWRIKIFGGKNEKIFNVIFIITALILW